MEKSSLHHPRRHLKSFIRHTKAHTKKDIAAILTSLVFILTGLGIFWISSFRLPDLSSFEQRKVSESTKIYDRTGKVLLYDMNAGVKRTIVSSENISPYIKKATVAIEDEDFYDHRGIKITSIVRATLANLVSGKFSQGGSTITQQVVKNTLLTQEKKISRKLKEWVLASKLDKALSKDKILEIYLNENPYGGNMYGIAEASKRFFGKEPRDVTLAEAAYLAAIPQATSYYSPYGSHVKELEARQKLVLEKMLKNGFITDIEYKKAMTERVLLQPQEKFGIRAPHFVFFVRDYVENILGMDSLDEGGYGVITTLDMNLQEQAEELVRKTALSNEKNFNAKNAALVALDPKTGDILSMVGSRDYFDTDIDGQFNVATAPNRQPGSTMKPIVYAEAFIKGYTPETVLFDLPTSFGTECDLEGKPLRAGTDPKVCYMPQNYDEKFRGPVSLRGALAQSINIPSIKTLYLAGVRESLALAKDMGITSLTNADQYGLTLVLGGGEISLLEMTSAYGVFAYDGNHLSHRPVLRIFDSKGNEIKIPASKQNQAMSANVARTISDILSDNTARTPAYGPNSVLYFPSRDVAVKTGTTNDSKDAWTIGYTPNLVVGVWAGNNDASPMVKKVAGQIVAPMWSSFMKAALDTIPDERFIPPTPADSSVLKPVMKGIWQGGQTYTIDKISKKIATEFTPPETRQEIPIQSVHSILYWVDKNDPLGPPPVNPSNDYQFGRWETPVRLWAAEQGLPDQTDFVIPTAIDDIHTGKNSFVVSIQNTDLAKKYNLDDEVSISVSSVGKYPIVGAFLHVNGVYMTTVEKSPFFFHFFPREISNIQETNNIKITAHDSVYNKSEVDAAFYVALDN
ncbi:MAG: PBP1A family penicillin-binding protein [Patescibacteria group bacterium]